MRHVSKTCITFEDSCVLGCDSLYYGKVSEESATSIFRTKETLAWSDQGKMKNPRQNLTRAEETVFCAQIKSANP
jgi:hypothetical protein